MLPSSIAVPNLGDFSDQRSAEKHAHEADVHDLLTANVQVESLDPPYTGTTAMAIVPLPLPLGAEARALLHHLLEHGDVVGRDAAGRTMIQLALDDWVLDKLMTFDADAVELEHGGDDEPDADDEEDGPPVVVDFVGPKVTRRQRMPSRAFGQVG
jgi:hypothetical protein